jgi:hypothetical protein
MHHAGTPLTVENYKERIAVDSSGIMFMPGFMKVSSKVESERTA